MAKDLDKYSTLQNASYSEALAVARANDGRCDVDYTCAAATETGLGLTLLYVAEGAANHSDGMLEPYCDYIRDIVGNPFHPVSIVPPWLSWCRDIIPKMAQLIYDECWFQDLPFLADALEDAGCENADILGHCRGPEPHVRGCWVVDLLLGKE